MEETNWKNSLKSGFGMLTMILSTDKRRNRLDTRISIAHNLHWIGSNISYVSHQPMPISLTDLKSGQPVLKTCDATSDV